MIVQLNNLYRHHSTIRKKINEAISNTINKSKYIAGSEVSLFEKQFSNLNQSKYCISCGNGTDALYIILKSLNLKKGDEIITTSHSWISTSEVITSAGAKVIFCDTKKDSFNICPKQIKKKITKKTKGLIIVHLHGNPCDMDQILQITKKNKIFLIEDCAQAHLSNFKNKNVGNFGIAGSFSFFPGKNLGALGDAGCVVTNNKRLAQKMRLFANHGGKNMHLIEGINSRLDGIHASVLNVKLKYLKSWTKRRVEIAAKYDSKLKGIGDLKIPKKNKNGTHVYHQYVVKTKYRDELKYFLKKNNIDTAIHYPVILPLLPAYNYRKFKKENFLNSFENQKQILSIPIFPELKKSEQNYVIKKIIEFFKNKI
jgi:dTDP-4-amino-4,6-dideoxygalactose transaminase